MNFTKVFIPRPSALLQVFPASRVGSSKVTCLFYTRASRPTDHQPCPQVQHAHFPTSHPQEHLKEARLQRHMLFPARALLLPRSLLLYSSLKQGREWESRDKSWDKPWPNDKSSPLDPAKVAHRLAALHGAGHPQAPQRRKRRRS